jgi:ectoine hydroxylase
MPSGDVYASRFGGQPAVVPRQDPVVYGDAADGPLTESDLQHFAQQGYLVLTGLFSASEVDEFAAELTRLRTDPALRGRPEVITEPGADEHVRSVFSIHTLSEHFARLAADERLAGRARQILGGPIYVHQSRANNKPAFSGKDFYWHSDFETWHVEDGMPRMRAVSCVVSLTENNEFNGPLMLVPGSHHHYVVCRGVTPERHYEVSLKHQEYGVPDHHSLAKLMEARGLISVKGPPGTVVLFDCNTMHGSSSNLSPLPRSNLFFVYNSVQNALTDPFGADEPRPEFIATRSVRPL